MSSNNSDEKTPPPTFDDSATAPAAPAEFATQDQLRAERIRLLEKEDEELRTHPIQLAVRAFLVKGRRTFRTRSVSLSLTQVELVGPLPDDLGQGVLRLVLGSPDGLYNIHLVGVLNPETHLFTIHDIKPYAYKQLKEWMLTNKRSPMFAAAA